MKTIQTQVDEYLNYCRYVRNMTDQTMQSKEYVFKKFVRETGISEFQEFTNKRLNEWVEYQLKSGVSGRTINTRVSHVVAFSKYLRDMDYEVTLRYTLIQKVKENPPRRLHYTREQIEYVKSHANKMEWLLIAMKFDSGLRLSELTNLRIENVNGHKLSFLGKGRKDRKSFISDETLERLEQWIEDNDITDYLWPSPVSNNERPYSTDEIRHIMHRAFSRVGFDEFYPHSMRHSFGTDLERNGAPITATQRLMGHSSPDTTQKYLHGFDNKLEEIYGKYKPSMKAGTVAA